ncbi:MAG: hypothetical protein M3394_05230, partial [Actinomycetota bacterium]|nr:hypothetical protein [Actinomycetota bacterium]
AGSAAATGAAAGTVVVVVVLVDVVLVLVDVLVLDEGSRASSDEQATSSTRSAMRVRRMARG